MPYLDGVSERRKASGSRKSKGFLWFIKRYGVGYSMLLPFVLLFFAFVVLPVFIAFGLSFTNYNMFRAPSFVGLQNYRLLLVEDKIFWTAMRNTMIFAGIVGPLGYFCSFFSAWVLNQLKFRNVFALIFYAPSICSGVAISAVWLYFFSSDRYGLINNALITMGFLDEPILWVQDPQYILCVIMVISIWMSMGTGFLVFLAGLQSIDKSLYEAGAIDGISSRWQELKYLTLPQMKPQLIFGAITAVTNSFGVFDIAVSVSGLPSPNYAGHTIVAHLYDYAFIRFQMGYASAIATILFLMTFVLGRVIMAALSEKDGKQGDRHA